MGGSEPESFESPAPLTAGQLLGSLWHQSGRVQVHLSKLAACQRGAVVVESWTPTHPWHPSSGQPGLFQGAAVGQLFPLQHKLTKAAAVMSSAAASEKCCDYRTNIQSQNHHQNLK